MKQSDVKAQAEIMAAQIFEYIDKALSDQEEKDAIYCELSGSFLTCAVHESDQIKAVKKIADICSDIGAMCCTGYIKFLKGDRTRVVKDLTKHDENM